MTVENPNVKNTYGGNGVTTVFPFTFLLNAEDVNNVVVTLTNERGQENATTDFTLSLNDKVVRYPKSGVQPLPHGWKITIQRQIPYTQTLNLTSQGPFFAEDIEAQLDRQEMQIQQLAEIVERTVRVSVSSDIDTADLIAKIFQTGVDVSAQLLAAQQSASAAAGSEVNAKNSEDAVRTMTEQVHAVFANSVAEIKKALGTEYVSQEQAKETRRIIDDKAPIASPALTGTPTVPTASKGTSTDQIASTAFVAQAVAALNGLDSIDGLAKAIEGKIEKQGIVASSLETNGWVKFANGLIVQWGTSMTAKIGTVTFPVSYPQQCFGVQANSCQLVNSSNPFRNVAIPYNISTSGFSFRVDDVSNKVQWIAIGI